MKKTKEEKINFGINIIDRVKKIHGDKYDYSKFEYVSAKTNVCIICPEHGEFWQRVDHHLNGSGCPECAGVSLMSFDKFCAKANKKHANKFTYEESTYTKASNKVGIVCPYHGLFYQDGISHLSGCGCPTCNGGVKIDVNGYIERARKKHGDYYDYSKVEYVNAKTKVCIICPRHGEFWQEADSHLCGKGCSKCKASVLENMVINALNKNNIFYQFQYKLPTMGKKSYDFFLPEYGLIIECQGEQHFTPVNFSLKRNTSVNDANQTFANRKKLDLEKYNAVLDSGYSIVYFTIPIFFRSKNVNTNLPFYTDKIMFNHTNMLVEYINNLPKLNKVHDNLLSFRNSLKTISDDFMFQDDSFTNKNYKIYFIKCSPNERDTLNSISRVNRKREYKSLFIFEDEWVNNKSIILNKLTHLFSKNILPKIGARKMVVSLINKHTETKFLNEFHIQGVGNSSVSLGCFYEDKLIAVMTFKKLSNNSNNYDLTRFASDYNYICQGVGSKMLSYFIKNYNPDSIISFADRRWTLDKDDNLYIKLGFTLDKVLSPDYKYYNTKVDRYKRFHKFGFRKQVLHKKYGLDLSLTETEMVKMLGYDRIWDCGLFKYKLDLKNKES